MRKDEWGSRKGSTYWVAFTTHEIGLVCRQEKSFYGDVIKLYACERVWVAIFRAHPLLNSADFM